MILKKTLFLSGFTARAQAYSQAMLKSGFEPEYTILFGPEKAKLPGQVDGLKEVEYSDSIFFPNLSIPLIETVKSASWDYVYYNCNNVNDPDILSAIKKYAPDWIIYSGYGSQLVKEELLSLKIPFLHLHSGLLPEYKGSTTLYYSWIKEQSCGVSAIYLLSDIDNGPIIARKKYPLPSDDIDPDYIYDCSIRADLLIEVLKKFVSQGKIPVAETQKESGSIYYVIHPLLKHIARLSSLPSSC